MFSVLQKNNEYYCKIRFPFLEQQVPKIILCVFDDYVLPEEFKCYIHLNFTIDDQCYNPWNNIEIAIMEHKDKTLTDE